MFSQVMMARASIILDNMMANPNITWYPWYCKKHALHITTLLCLNRWYTLATKWNSDYKFWWFYLLLSEVSLLSFTSPTSSVLAYFRLIFGPMGIHVLQGNEYLKRRLVRNQYSVVQIFISWAATEKFEREFLHPNSIVWCVLWSFMQVCLLFE